MRASMPGSAARSERTFSSVASLNFAAAATIGAAVFTASPIGIPSLAPWEKLSSGERSRFSDHQSMRRAAGCMSSSPKRSASSTAVRSAGSAG